MYNITEHLFSYSLEMYNGPLFINQNPYGQYKIIYDPIPRAAKLPELLLEKTQNKKILTSNYGSIKTNYWNVTVEDWETGLFKIIVNNHLYSYFLNFIPQSVPQLAKWENKILVNLRDKKETILYMIEKIKLNN